MIVSSKGTSSNKKFFKLSKAPSQSSFSQFDHTEWLDAKLFINNALNDEINIAGVGFIFLTP